MILERVSVRNWRGVRDERAVSFEQGMNLLVGPNEAGKSSLLEAVLRGLLDRHGSRTQDLRRIRPWGSSLAPEVRLVLRAGGERLRVEKRFLHEPFSRVFVERGGRFELAHEGDKADTHLRRLLLEESSRGSAKPTHRGIAQALWYLQRDDALPRRWSSALEEGLAGLIGNVLTDPVQDQVLQRLHKEYESTYTPTGRLKARSDLKAIEDEHAALSGDLEQQRGDIARVVTYREELEELATRRAELRARLETVRGEREELDRRGADAPELEKQIASHTRSVEESKSSLEQAERRLGEIGEIEQLLDDLARQLSEHEDREAALRVAVREQRRAAERHARRWEDELEPKLTAVRAEIEELRNKMRIEQLESELAEIDRRKRRIVELRVALEAAEEVATELEAITPEDVALARRLQERAEALRTQVEAAAIVFEWRLENGHRLVFDPEGSAAEDSGSGEPAEGDENSRLLTRATAIEIPGVAEFRVRSNDQQLEEMDRQVRRGAEELAALLERLGVTSVDELVQRDRQRREADLEVHELRARLAETLGAPPESAGSGDAEPLRALALRRKDLQQELETLRAIAPQAVLPGMEDWAEERTLDQLRELEARRRRFEKQIAEEREAEQTAQQACLERNEDLVAAGQRAAGIRAESRAHRSEMEKRRARHGDEAAQQQATEVLRARLDQEKRRLEAAQEEWFERVEQPRARRLELVEAEQDLVEELRELDARRADRQARIEEVTALGLDGRIGDLEGRLAAVAQRREILRRRAEAVLLLERLLRHHEADRNATLVEPVRELLDGWLSRLTQERYTGVTLGEDLVPEGVQAKGYEDAQPMESMSHGSYEQIAVLLRLALGVLLSSEERQLVVLDDGLVNADSARQARLLPILEEAAEHCQIIVATCRPVAYDGLDAHRVEIEPTSRWSPRVLSGGE